MKYLHWVFRNWDRQASVLVVLVDLHMVLRIAQGGWSAVGITGLQSDNTLTIGINPAFICINPRKDGKVIIDKVSTLPYIPSQLTRQWPIPLVMKKSSKGWIDGKERVMRYERTYTPAGAVISWYVCNYGHEPIFPQSGDIVSYRIQYPVNIPVNVKIPSPINPIHSFSIQSNYASIGSGILRIDNGILSCDFQKHCFPKSISIVSLWWNSTDITQEVLQNQNTSNPLASESFSIPVDTALLKIQF